MINAMACSTSPESPSLSGATMAFLHRGVITPGRYQVSALELYVEPDMGVQDQSQIQR